MADDDGKYKKSCDRLRHELRDCLIYSDCVQKDKRTPRECLKLGTHNPTVPMECHELRYRFFQCKRSIIDMRARFRGIKD
ncbi:cytochrome c oxidase assembly factor 5-like [Mytilus galloprovincialis]|uniref:cytochrome c oxidase assembly factor 5-like n=1 Tax=Mytilus edulis TaxID=6550 RepID=UPI0039EFBC90